MKLLKKIIIITAFLFLILPAKVNAATTVNMYLFYGKECPHCQALEEALIDIQKDYPNLKIYKYEVWHNQNNARLMAKASEKINVSASGVPFTIIGTKAFSGYSQTQTKAAIEYALKLYSGVDNYSDPIGKILSLSYSQGTLTYDEINAKYEKDNNVIIDAPIIGQVSTKNLSLPIISMTIGLIDGFNPCAMWVLLFLISVLLGMKDRKRMWILGLTFLATSAIIYLVFMLAWLNLAIFIGALWWVKLLIAVVALVGGILNVRAFLRAKEAGCEVVDEKKRKKIFTRVKDFTSQKSFFIAFFGIIALAISVNFIELTCSAGLPVIFTNILAINHLSTLEYAFYIFLYLLFFLIDDLVVFFIAMKTLKLTGISNKYGKYSHLIGGVIMILIGILLVFKPEWLMFNF